MSAAGRPLLVAATLVAVGVLTGGCGGDDGASTAAKPEASPSTVTTSEFCDAYTSLSEAFPAGVQPTDKQAVAAIKAWAGTMRSTGTPRGIPADAQRGFDLVLTTVDKIKPDATQADVRKLSEAMTADQQAESQAFAAYASETCPTKASSGAPASPPASPSASSN